MGRSLTQTFFQRRHKMVKRHLKRCLTLLITREMEIKATGKYGLTLGRITIIEVYNNKCWRGCGEKGRNPCALLVGM